MASKTEPNCCWLWKWYHKGLFRSPKEQQVSAFLAFLKTQVGWGGGDGRLMKPFCLFPRFFFPLQYFRFLVFMFVCIFTRESVRISLCRRLLRCTLLRQMREYSHQKTYSGVKRMLGKLKLLENVYKHGLE